MRQEQSRWEAHLVLGSYADDSEVIVSLWYGGEYMGIVRAASLVAAEEVVSEWTGEL